MAAIQTSFAVMPAAVYWFGGLALAHGSQAITIPTLVSFTTLQARLFFPVGSLLGVGLDVQTSLALFDRIFEYLDLPIEITDRPNAIALSSDDIEGYVAYDDVSKVKGNNLATGWKIAIGVGALFALALILVWTGAIGDAER